MHNKTEISFDEIVCDIKNNKNYQELKKEFHHGIDRYTHSLRVAKATYKISKKLGFDYVSATRGAMLHDFFKNDEYGNVTGINTLKIHPHIACYNAKQEFKLNEIEEDVIRSHMYPLNTNTPSFKESWLVNYVDEGVSLYELSRYKLSTQITVFILFILNMLMFGQK